MKNDYVTRDRIMNLLSDDETAKVSTAETAKQLTAGEEYIDLTQLDKGVLIASLGKGSPPMGNVLPKSAVHVQTWTNIVAALPKGNKNAPKGPMAAPPVGQATKRSNP
jgi:hypothetical protein